MSALRKFFSSIWPVVLKYLFSIIVAIYAFVCMKDGAVFGIAMMELVLIFLSSNELARFSRVAASVLSSVLLLLFDLQQFLLIFSNSFLTLVMLTNLDSLEDLSGKAVVYVLAAIVMLAFICLPVRHIDLRLPAPTKRFGGVAGLLFLLFTLELVSIEVLGPSYSSFFAYVDLANQHAENVQEEEELKQMPNLTVEYYRPDVTDRRPKPAQLPEHPNIVLIFTEGLSQSVVDDEREIMSNVARYQQQSLTFSSYYNHTFATYRGLIGQLFSGYQYSNLDTNTLVSLPMVLRNYGYSSAFLNVEAYNNTFSDYLGTLGYDEVIGLHDPQRRGPVDDGYSDKLAYEALFEEMETRSNTGQPFLLSIYTFGTHASFDSADEKFGDGSDSELNKFYDADYQFGQFMDRFVESPMLDNTIIVFTADHATYSDMYFTQAFPDYEREHTELDEVPLFLYYKDVEPEVVDAGGRNSLDLVPTILDFCDLSGANYFLGSSLFGPYEEAASIETCYNNGSASFYSTAGGSIQRLADAEKETYKNTVWTYYAAKQQEPLAPEDVDMTALSDAELQSQNAAAVDAVTSVEVGPPAPWQMVGGEAQEQEELNVPDWSEMFVDESARRRSNGH